MTARIAKLKDKAAKLSRDKKYDKALAVYAELRREEPQNPRWPQKQGEALQRLRRLEEAIASFDQAAELHAAGGFLLKAIALCKMILALDPARSAVYDRLAALNAQSAQASPGTLYASEAFIPPPQDSARAIPLPPAERMAEAPAPGGAVAQPQQPAVGGASEPPSAEAPREMPSWLIPAGSSLEALPLGRVVPGAQAATHDLGEGSMFEIPIDDIAGEDEIEVAVAVEKLSAKEELAASVAPTPLFSSLHPDALRMLIERVELRLCQEGEAVIREGAVEDTLYVLVEGELEVSHRGTPINRMTDGAFFGEIALLSTGQRSATVVALTDCTLLVISRKVIADLIEEYPEVLKVLLRFFRERLLTSLAETSPLFASFAGPLRQALVRRFSFIEAEPGCVLLQQGQVADAMYVVLTGQALEIGADQPFVCGQFFGVRSLLANTPAEATVRSATKCWLLRLDHDALQALIAAEPRALQLINELSASR